ncbi:related to methyltransferase [Rhynchosporium agropyri]|uniref:Related to methyltransferase n=1 Tax=Rhynchosporium agropyri TaxID=914238 RepID=A0A1E1KN68_9HELO|nr:related to methyltransferase [Rhynchosporium agropyri]
MEHRVENVDSVASNLVWSGLGSPVQHVNDASHTDGYDDIEIILGPDGYDDFDSDSALGLGHRYSTTTLSSIALRTVEKYGRSYHAYQDGKYLMPNDEQERERLGGRLHLASLPATQRVLEIGTGTGIWSIQFADENPGVEVLGVDLSPMQPDWVPPNCTFQIDDVSLTWTFEIPFDFIHGRMLFCSFSDPLHVFREAFKALAAGGVIEMQELIFDFLSPDHSLEGSALATWANKVKAAFGSRGIDLTSASRCTNDLETAGFEDIHQKEFIWPVGRWPRDPKLKSLGSWCKENILDMLFAMSIVPFTEHYQQSMSVEEVELLLVQVRKDLQNPEMHAYLQIVIVYGRKPKSDMFLELEV